VTGIGLSVPFSSYPLAAHRDVLSEAVDLGYTSAWSSESNATDALTPLAMAAAWQPGLALGAAVVPAQTRGPAVLAQGFAALAEATPSRVIAGVGASTPVVVQDWNDTAFDRPYQRVRDTVRYLRAVLAGEKVTAEYETFTVNGFRLLRPPRRVPSIMVAAVRPGMLRLAGREADGAIINWVSPEDVAQISPIVTGAADPVGSEIVARLFVCPTADSATVRDSLRPFLTQYVTPPGHRDFHEWIGRGDRLREVFRLWDCGERRQAAAAFPDAVIDEIVVHGPPEACRERLQSYLDAGLSGATFVPLGITMDEQTAMRRLGRVGSFTTPARVAAAPQQLPVSSAPSQPA
jgi:probable F420-dependent oxidoreductase